MRLQYLPFFQTTIRKKIKSLLNVKVTEGEEDLMHREGVRVTDGRQ